jgi:hypothetical protein
MISCKTLPRFRIDLGKQWSPAARIVSCSRWERKDLSTKASGNGSFLPASSAESGTVFTAPRAADR